MDAKNKAVSKKGETLLLSRLSIFAEGWTEKAAQEVCSDSDLTKSEITSYLKSLIEKFLVYKLGGLRYALPESVREEYRDYLSEEDTNKLYGKHFQYYLTLAREYGMNVLVSDAAAVFTKIENEENNLWLALEWARRDEVSSSKSLSLGGALGGYFYTRGYHKEGREYLQDAIQRSSGQDIGPEVWATACYSEALLAWMQMDLDVSRARCAEAIALFRALNPAVCDLPYDLDGRITGALCDLAGMNWAAGDLEVATKHNDEVLQNKIWLDNPSVKHHIAYGWYNRGLIALSSNDPVEARAAYEKSLSLYIASDSTAGLIECHAELGWTFLAIGDLIHAYDHFKQVLDIASETFRYPNMTAFALEGLAQMLIRQTKYVQATIVFGGIDYLRRHQAGKIPTIRLANYEQTINNLRMSLNDNVQFDAVWGHGYIMPLHDLMEYAAQQAK